MRIEYDEDVDAAYIYFGRAEPQVARTISVDPISIQGMVNLDIDSDGRILGIEIMDASQLVPADELVEWKG